MAQRVNPAATHLLEWFTPHRKLLISSRALDSLAGRPLGTFSRFLAGQKGFTFTRAKISAYYPFLKELGYLPPDLTL